ncbi:MAG TPA: ATP-binding cassette domain-containing protein [Anaerolineales bacterium]|nr:ATP-binding cassette domain-containing protein [Anaerolineales bacterium]
MISNPTPSVEVNEIAKAFGPTQAVQDISFAVQRGEIFGLLGPNGAGKTTTIRIILDIFKADRGSVVVLGGPMTEAKKDLIGYMPEDRGLYQDIPLEQCLQYLGRLKGMSAVEMKSRLGELLERFDLATHKKKKVKELSKGMQQKAQIITTILHQPELIIIDEPFTALDPLNTQAVKDLIRELSAEGATILMSTHQMHQVEELCDRILLIDQGCNLLYGRLDEIQRQFSGHAVLVRTDGKIPQVPGVQEITQHNKSVQLTLKEDTTPQQVLKSLLEAQVIIEKFELAVPSLDEIFVRAVKGGQL